MLNGNLIGLWRGLTFVYFIFLYIERCMDVFHLLFIGLHTKHNDVKHTDSNVGFSFFSVGHSPTAVSVNLAEILNAVFLLCYCLYSGYWH